MKLSNKQAHQLVALLQSSISKNVIDYLCYPFEQRLEMLNIILDQQDHEVVELKVDKGETDE